MRMFVAIPVPDSVKQQARMLRNELGASRADIKWVEYQNYHLTLKFLGEVSEATLPEIRKNLHLAAESCPAFNMSAGGLGYFPSRNRPRVIWMGLKGELDKAKFLGERVDAYLLAMGFEEEKEHSLHLTLGRVRSDIKNHDLIKIGDNLAAKSKLTAFRVNEFELMRSSLTPTGPVYNVLDTFTLKG